ncbi:hypothetical protein LCGC14_1894620 [marine sediment metagenome]|uniref:Uncharacterized protein n=1 Tax=marine sediment metagenome TaxID=412755 RepID=A0A0F9GLR6_9ZZZZ
MNRRSFIQRCFGVAVGVCAAFALGKKPVVLANSTDKVKRWYPPQPQVTPLTEGMEPPPMPCWTSSHSGGTPQDSVFKVDKTPFETLRNYDEPPIGPVNNKKA